MSSTMRTVQNDKFPKLGWLASLDLKTHDLEVLHGSAVEHQAEWLVEGVWDDSFANGDFHMSENFFGSGVRVDDGRAWFAASSASVDRLVYCTDGNMLRVSNSLIVLLAMTGARLDTDHDYRLETKAILDGQDYRKDFHVLHPTIKSFYQVYCENLVVDGRDVLYERRGQPREFSSFGHYKEMVSEALVRMRDNFKDPARKTALSSYSTLSTGYDSSAVSCLVKDIGVTQCFSFTGSWTRKSSSDPLYDAAPIAEALGLSIIPLNSFRNEGSQAELYMHAASPAGAQLPLIVMAAYLGRTTGAAVVFTGYHGDVIWNVNPAERYLRDPLLRAGVSGIDLTELRLRYGFINVPITFLFVQSIRRIVAVSNLPEMKPWRLNNDYDRPIPRRILEQSGVERSHFGIRKGAIFNHYSRPIDPSLRELYAAFVRRHHDVGSIVLYVHLIGDRLSVRGLTHAARILRSLGLNRLQRKLLRRKHRLSEGESLFGKRVNLKALLFFWAVDRLTAQLEDDVRCRSRN
jgi:hypothetical protein